MCCALLRSQCLHGIDLRRAQCGQIHTCEGNDNEQGCCYAERRRVEAPKGKWRSFNHMSKCPYRRFGKCNATGQSDGDLAAAPAGE